MKRAFFVLIMAIFSLASSPSFAQSDGGSGSADGSGPGGGGGGPRSPNYSVMAPGLTVDQVNALQNALPGVQITIAEQPSE